MARKQLNLSLTLEQYGWLEELAQEAGETPTKYARLIVLDAISPALETDLGSGVLVLSQPRNRKGLEAKGRTDGLGPSLRKSVWVIVIWR